MCVCVCWCVCVCACVCWCVCVCACVCWVCHSPSVCVQERQHDSAYHCNDWRELRALLCWQRSVAPAGAGSLPTAIVGQHHITAGVTTCDTYTDRDTHTYTHMHIHTRCHALGSVQRRAHVEGKTPCVDPALPTAAKTPQSPCVPNQEAAASVWCWRDRERGCECAPHA